MESFIWLAVAVILYLIPTWWAVPGRRGSVFIINFFLGWTFIGWIVAMFLAFRSREQAAEQRAKGGA